MSCDSPVNEVKAFGLLACVWLLGWGHYSHWQCCINLEGDLRGWWV